MGGNGSISSPEICEAAWSFYRGQRQAVLNVFQGWEKESRLEFN